MHSFLFWLMHHVAQSGVPGDLQRNLKLWCLQKEFCMLLVSDFNKKSDRRFQLQKTKHCYAKGGTNVMLHFFSQSPCVKVALSAFIHIYEP